MEKRPEHEGREIIWQIAARRSTYQRLSKRSVLYTARRKIEKVKAQVRAKVEHPFRGIKRQFGYTKVRFRGLTKNTAQLVTLFALSNLWMARALAGRRRRGTPVKHSSQGKSLASGESAPEGWAEKGVRSPIGCV